MFAHVDEIKSLAGGVQCPLNHRLWGAHKGVDCSVSGGPRVDIQQAAAGGAANGCGDGIDHLGKQEKVAEHRPQVWVLVRWRSLLGLRKGQILISKSFWHEKE